MAETCGEIDGDAKRLLASPAQRSDLLSLKHIARRALENSECDGEYVYRLARVLALVALSDLEEKAAAENRSLTSRELQPLSEISKPWQLMTHLGDAHFAEKDWLKAFDAYDIALTNLDTRKSDERQLYGEVYAKAIVARAFLTNDSANDRSQSRPNAPQFRTVFFQNSRTKPDIGSERLLSLPILVTAPPAPKRDAGRARQLPEGRV